MIITTYSNIDLIQGVIAYGNVAEGITDWRITNTPNGILNILNSSSIIKPQGGTYEIGEITNSSDRYMVFKEGTSTFTVPSGGIVCDILIVGGGGGGGFDGSGGGGGGEVKYYTDVSSSFKTGNAYTLTAGIYTINVGTGGSASANINSPGANGTISEIKNNLGITLLSAGGGGGGGSKLTNGVSGVGGGGGAGMGGSYTGGTSTGSGGIGGLSYSGSTGGGGGGGANVANKNGGNGQSTGGGTGGVGVNINIIGTSVGYGGGGGGGTWQPLTQVIGTHGGGNGGTERANPSIGLQNTGGGGGGGGNATYTSGTSGVGSGGSGGSGIVIIRYSTTNLSIIENGNVGIGTTPISASSKLEISGDVNINGIYKKNNRDIIGDTSNYVLATSNVIVPRIITEVGHSSNYVSRIATQLNTRIDDTSNYVARVALSGGGGGSGGISSQWTNVSLGIHYTPTPSLAITSSPSATIGTAGDYTYMVFTYTTETAGAGTGQTLYNITVPTGGAVCDVLVVGGGGGGDQINGGGGGGGAVLYATNITIPASSYVIKVGKGGAQNVNGSSTECFGAICLGGGSTPYVAWNTPNNGTAGGSGSGGSPGSWSQSTTGFGGGVGVSTKGTILNTGTLYNGYSGGNGIPQVSGTGNVSGGGGGGAGSAGLSSSITQYSTRSSWISGGKPSGGGDGIQINITGSVYYWGAGGGGGGTSTHAGDGGLGGGGGGGITGSPAIAGLAGISGINTGGNGNVNGSFMSDGGNGAPNTGSGGGGGGDGGNGGTGGSGIVILRFLSSSRNVGIGTTNPTSELHVYDDTTTNTKLTVQNNYIDPIVLSPNTIGYTIAESLESGKYYRTLTFNYFPNYPQDPPNTALLAWYRFNGDGLDYNPYATKYNLVANSGTPTYSSGSSADSFFQGRRYINTGTGSLKVSGLSLNSRAFSIATWMRTKNTAEAFFIGQSTSAGTNISLHIGQRGNNAYTLGFFGNDLECGAGVSGNPTTYPGDVNTWVHIVYVVLPNYNRRIYRNGVLISTDSNTSAFLGSGDLRIGANYNTNASQNVDINDFRLYNNGLSATEVATLYASYNNLVITDNYAVNFKSSTALVVNGTSKTVNGEYTVSMGNINASMLPMGGQADTPLSSTAITTLPIKYEYNNTGLTLPTLITVAGATSSFIGTTERGISFTYTSDTLGLTGQTQYSLTPVEDLWCDILVVGGGGGGGHGGGGGGGVLFSNNLKINAGITVTVRVGNGGTGTAGGSFATSANGTNGYNSSIIINSVEYIAVGGGGGGTRDNNGSCPARNGNSGGSGGGGSHGNVAPYGVGGASNKYNYANFQSFGNNGGLGRQGTSGSEPNHTSGGGGGAGSKGADVSSITGGGNGGQGKEFISYFGTNVGHNGYFGGGGGGQTAFSGGNRGYGNGGLGLYGGGGDSANEYTPILLAHNGLSNTGGGGGGGRFQGATYTLNGGNGGSGFVIIRYRKNTTQSSSLELVTTASINITEPTTTLDRITKNTGMTGWVQIKHLPGGAETGNRTWFSGNTFSGSTVNNYTVGSPSNNAAEWSIPFDSTSAQFYLFYENTNDFNGEWNDRWIVMKKSDMVAIDYPNWRPFYKASSYPNGKTEGLQYNRISAGQEQDPNIGLGHEHTRVDGVATTSSPYKYWNAIYIENSATGWNGAPPAEVNVYVKFTTDLPIINIPKELTNYNYKYMLFTHSGSAELQTSYTVNFPENTLCDILVVGGGGGGGSGMGGGGGGGQVIYAKNITVPIGTYNILVGSGGAGGTTNNGVNGNNSIAFGATANGGGGGGGVGSWSTATSIGLAGGSGGGGGANSANTVQSAGTVTIGSLGYLLASAVTYGNVGGTGLYNASGGGGGGGGGAGAVGSSGNSSKANGGNGIIIDITGASYYWAGGGGGASWSTSLGSGNGGFGGGGGGACGAGVGTSGINGLGGININTVQSTDNGKGADGANNTGGGGGAGTYNGQAGGRGGSGIVIIRYKSTRIGNQGYSIGNYNGDFKIVSTTSSPNSAITTNTDYLRITRDGSSIFNPTGTPSWSTVSDRRIKENIEKASYDKCYESIDKLALYRFSYIKELHNINKDLRQLGYIAQEVKEIFPKSVSSQEFHNEELSITDMLSIDITQINYSLHGAIKKLVEMYDDIEKKINILENILQINTSNIVVDSSNIVVDSSNIVVDSSNIVVDTSNLVVDSSNIVVDSSNLLMDTSNLVIDTSNIVMDTSNIVVDTSNIVVDTSNIVVDTSNIVVDTSNITSN
jgi:hypothetical protein